MMSFEVKVSPAAQNDLAGRALTIQQAIVKTLSGDLRERPGEVGVALQGPLADYRSLTRGSYKILYKVMPGEVWVVRIHPHPLPRKL